MMILERPELHEAREALLVARGRLVNYVKGFFDILDLRAVDVKDAQRERMSWSDAAALLNAAHQVDKALRDVEGLTFDPKLRPDIKPMRDLHEHWEQHKASFAHREIPKTRSGATYQKRHPDGPPPWSRRFDGSGMWLGPINLGVLLEELNRLLRELEERAAGEGITLDASRPVAFPVRPQAVGGFRIIGEAEIYQEIQISGSELRPVPGLKIEITPEILD